MLGIVSPATLSVTKLPMRKALVLLFAALVLSGCNFIYRQPVFQGNLLDKANVEQLKPGMTREQVISLVGTPVLADPFHQQRWDYVATERRGHGDTQVKNLTLWFEGDALVVPTKVDRESTYGFFTRQLKDWTQILYQFGIGAAAFKVIR